MDAIYFVLKSLAITFLVVLFMQIKWGNETIEFEAYQFLTESRFVQPLEDVASGTVVLVRNSWLRATKAINTNFTRSLQSENQPGQRHLQFGVERSKQFIETNAQKAERAWGDVKSSAGATLNENSDNTASIVERFKTKVSSVSRKVKSKFIDETDVPVETTGNKSKTQSNLNDRSSAKSTNDDEMIEEE